VRGHRIGVDLGLLKAGFDIGREFGWHSLEEMARIALYVEREIYESGSLRSVPGGIAFTLRSPPLRMGAFQRAQLLWDGQALDGAGCTAHPEDSGTPVRFDQLSRDAPLVLPVGRRVEFAARIAPAPVGRHTIRLELQSLAIPPTVWMQVSDEVRPPAPESS